MGVEEGDVEATDEEETDGLGAVWKKSAGAALVKADDDDVDELGATYPAETHTVVVTSTVSVT